MLLYISIVLAFFVSTCYGLECYDCASKDDLKCLDPFSPARMEYFGTSECGPKATHCVKYKTVVWLQDSGFILGKERRLNVTTRTCIQMKGEKDGCVVTEGGGGFFFRCLCSTDNCNSGRTIVPSFILLLLSAFVTFVMCKR